MKSNYDAVGFIPLTKIEEQEKRGLVFHQFEMGEWVGYLVVGTIKPGQRVHIWQECIDKSARGYGSGMRLFLQLLDACKKNLVPDIVLRCADDLEANEFWQACGFSKIKTDPPHNKRNRSIHTYRMVLIENLFETEYVQILG